MYDVPNSIDHERRNRVPFYLKLMHGIPNPHHVMLVQIARALHAQSCSYADMIERFIKYK